MRSPTSDASVKASQSPWLCGWERRAARLGEDEDGEGMTKDIGSWDRAQWHLSPGPAGGGGGWAAIPLCHPVSLILPYHPLPPGDWGHRGCLIAECTLPVTPGAPPKALSQRVVGGGHGVRHRHPTALHPPVQRVREATSARGMVRGVVGVEILEK